jgi:hypothetical protein
VKELRNEKIKSVKKETSNKTEGKGWWKETNEGRRNGRK